MMYIFMLSDFKIASVVYLLHLQFHRESCPQIPPELLFFLREAVYQHAHFIPIVGVGKERRTFIGPW